MRIHPISVEELAARRGAWLASQSLGELQQDPGTDLGSVITKVALDNQRNGLTHEATFTDWPEAEATQQRLEQLFGGIVPIPELSELAEAGIDFARLQAGFAGYEAAGMQPELILAPVNLPLATWQAIYSRLRVWQETAHPDSDYRLQQQEGKDGLWVTDDVTKSWDSLSQQAVEQIAGSSLVASDGTVWKALVVPTATKASNGLVVNVSHDLSTGQDKLAEQAEASHQPLGAVTEANAHMPTQAYLTLQANHTLQNTPLLDKNTYTWTAGHLNNSGLSPAAGWYPDRGRVRVYGIGVGYFYVSVGVRLPVWG